MITIIGGESDSVPPTSNKGEEVKKEGGGTGPSGRRMEAMIGVTDGDGRWGTEME